ncbi:MAG: AAA family ATPase [Planctomycetota bacterium]
MSIVVAVCNRKGGVGKTTVAVGLAVELMRRGKRVLLGDADPQASAKEWSALALSRDIETPMVVGLGEHFHRPGQLDQLAEGYDYVILDTPPHNGVTMRSALAVADLAVLPVTVAGIFDAWAVNDSAELVKQVKELKPTLRAALILNRAVHTRTADARHQLEDCGLPILRSTLGQRLDFADAVASGMGPTTYAPRSKASEEFEALCDELLAMLANTEGSVN